MYLRQAHARDAEALAQQLVISNLAFNGGQGATQTLRELNKTAEG